MSNWEKVIMGGAMERLTIKPRWYLYWSPKAWKQAKLATLVAHHQGKKLKLNALDKLTRGKL